jgi:GxxExxY protein
MPTLVRRFRPKRGPAAVGADLVVRGGMPIYAHDPRSYQINGAAMEVHRVLRRGLLEQLYCEALAIEFELRNIPFVAQVPCQILYKDRPLSGFYKIDFICFESIVVEVKAVSALTPADAAQLLNYLALTKHRLGLLLNFGSKSLEHRRFVLDQ